MNKKIFFLLFFVEPSFFGGRQIRGIKSKGLQKAVRQVVFFGPAVKQGQRFLRVGNTAL
jgi:hypothetical protein